jgi:hypothetical protein
MYSILKMLLEILLIKGCTATGRFSPFTDHWMKENPPRFHCGFQNVFKDHWWQPFNRFQVKIYAFGILKRLTGRNFRISK